MSLPSVHFVFAGGANQPAALFHGCRSFATNFAKTIRMLGGQKETQDFPKQLHHGKKIFPSFGAAYKTMRSVAPTAIADPKMITLQFVVAENVRLLLRCCERMVAAYAMAIAIAILVSGSSQPAWRFSHDH